VRGRWHDPVGAEIEELQRDRTRVRGLKCDVHQTCVIPRQITKIVIEMRRDAGTNIPDSKRDLVTFALSHVCLVCCEAIVPRSSASLSNTKHTMNRRMVSTLLRPFGLLVAGADIWYSSPKKTRLQQVQTRLRSVEKTKIRSTNSVDYIKERLRSRRSLRRSM